MQIRGGRLTVWQRKPRGHLLCVHLVVHLRDVLILAWTTKNRHRIWLIDWLLRNTKINCLERKCLELTKCGQCVDRSVIDTCSFSTIVSSICKSATARFVIYIWFLLYSVFLIIDWSSNCGNLSIKSNKFDGLNTWPGLKRHCVLLKWGNYPSKPKQINPS